MPALVPPSPAEPFAARAPGRLPGKAIGLALALTAASYALATLPVLRVMGTLSVALLLGIAWRAAAGVPDRAWPGVRFSARTLLRLGIVLMGARLDYGVLLAAGPKILLIAVTVITVAIVGVYQLARRFGLPRDLGLLMAVGTGVCGASAVAAASSVTRSDDEATTLAVAMMGLLGTVGVFFYVAVGGLLGLTTSQLGVLTGATLHEVAQVMAAGFTWGTQSGDMATMVKLSRVVLLAPVLVVVGWWWARTTHDPDAAAGPRYSLANPPIPYFVLGFLALGAVNSLGVLGAGPQAVLTQVGIFLMALAMAAMGLATDLAQVRRAGLGAVAAGLIGFFGLSVLVYGMIRVLAV
jgi:uncharacterized integral membrane protein (TIGR00698 family)